MQNAQTHSWKEGIFDPLPLFLVGLMILFCSTLQIEVEVFFPVIIPAGGDAALFAVEELKSKDSDHWTRMRIT